MSIKQKLNLTQINLERKVFIFSTREGTVGTCRQLSAEAFLGHLKQTLAQRIYLHKIHYFVGKSVHQQGAGIALTYTSGLKVEQSLFVQLAHGGTVTALHIIGINLQKRFGGDSRLVRQGYILVGLDRETYRIAAECTVTRDDYFSGRVFHDAVCNAFYPIDMHDAVSGIHPVQLPEGVVATVPLRGLVPKGSRNFLVAGRCVGSDREANSGLRVQAACMAMGQAAGAAAACAAARGCAPLEVPLGQIDSVLRKWGAIVPDREALEEGRK